LDEPLSLASHDRLQSLVDLVTGPLLSQHFEQTFFISHSSSFDSAMFPYHIYIDNGMVMRCNLPDVGSPTLLETLGSSNGDTVVSSTLEPNLKSSASTRDLRELTI